jgi:hypothetical protein
MPFGGRGSSGPYGRRHLRFFLDVILSVFSQRDTCPGASLWHPSDVSSLSGPAKFEPVSTPLQGSLRFFLRKEKGKKLQYASGNNKEQSSYFTFAPTILSPEDKSRRPIKTNNYKIPLIILEHNALFSGRCFLRSAERDCWGQSV